jgi:PAS domain S-box-containing protein
LTSGLQVSKVTVCKGRRAPLSRDNNKADLNPIGFEQDKRLQAFSGAKHMSYGNSKERLINRIDELERRNTELEALDARRQSVEEALRDSEMRFRSLAQSAVDAIISIDSEDKIIFWNKGAERIFRHLEEEVMGRSVIMLIPESLREAHRTGVQRYLATGERRLIGNTVELRGLTKDGMEFPLELSLSTWRTREGTFFTGMIRDVTRRKEAEQALEQRTIEARQRNEELESLIQMVAHDLKSPVITIGGLVRLLKGSMAKVPADDRMEQILNQLSLTSESVERFLRDLLDGLVSEHTEPERTEVRLDEVVNEVVRQHRQMIDEKGITLDVEIAAALTVLGDGHRIRQVLDNLVINAIRHMGETNHPLIRIQVLSDQDHVVTKVSDNGVGIPAQYLDKIFERFFRGSKSGVQGGTGLGLSIAKKIIESHGGRIWVESEEGKGATFVFVLPKS